MDRFTQYTKRKYEINIGPLIKEENMSGTDDWNTNQEETARLPVGTGTRGNAPNNKIQTPNRPRQYQNRQTFIYKYIYIQQILLTEKKQIQLKRRFSWTKPTDKETTEGHRENLHELDREREFPEFSNELLVSKFITSITNWKLREKLMKEKD